MRNPRVRRNPDSIIESVLILYYTQEKYTKIKALIKKAKSNKSKGYRKGGEKTYTKQEVNVLIDKKANESFQGIEET